jgi:hypothetical protein
MNKTRLALFLLSLCLVFVPISASTFEVSEDLCIIGNGTIERDFTAQSTADYAGQKLFETIRPIYSPNGSFTSSSYSSNFELILSNNSSIYCVSDSDLRDVKHYLSNKNYKLGVSTGFYYIGTQNKSFTFESSPSLSEAIVRSEAEGRSVLRARVVNVSHHQARTIDSLIWLEGNYSLEWNFLVIAPEFPEAGEDDWLLCPGG